jgi:hypothetical protein
MASGTQELDLFVRDALGKGVSRAELQAVLDSAGWPAEQSRHALSAYADLPFVVPVPRPRPYLSAREAFLYLVLFSTLYLSAWNLGSLLFHLINRAFPDPAEQADLVSRLGDAIRWSAAALIIVFPVFLYVARYLGRELAASPVKRLSAIRRWLTYLTLFVASMVLIGDMTALIYRLLGGEMTIRFVLKVVVAAVIAGTVFGYYLSDLRHEERAA